MEADEVAEARVKMMIDQMGVDRTREVVRDSLKLAISMASAWNKLVDPGHFESSPERPDLRDG